MAEELRHELLRIRGLRGGTTTEIANFLTDMELAYNTLYWLEEELNLYRFARPHLFDFHLPIHIGGLTRHNNIHSKEYSGNISPNFHLTLNSVNINSPGMWEFFGSMNPLLQIREFLKDRHKRRKDRDYREAEEKKSLQLNNELLKNQIVREHISILNDYRTLLQDNGIPDPHIQRIIWDSVGPPLSRLGDHQDSGLIKAH